MLYIHLCGGVRGQGEVHPKYMLHVLLMGKQKCIFRPLVKSAYRKIIFLMLNQTYVVGALNGSFEHPKHILKLMDKTIF